MLSSATFTYAQPSHLNPAKLVDVFALDHLRMTEGPHEGKKIRTDLMRSYRILSEDEAALVIPLSKIKELEAEKGPLSFYANVSHHADGIKNKFWVAVIPSAHPIKRVVFEITHFNPTLIAAHVFIRFDFEADSKPLLFSQTEPGTDPIELSSLVISVEAAPVWSGPKYGPIAVMRPNFGLATRLVSLEDRVKKMFREKDLTEQYEMILSSEQQQEFWKFGLTYLHDPEMKGIYHICANNCSTTLFEMIDAYQESTHTFIDKMLSALPVLDPTLLARRKLIDKRNPLITFNEEFGMTKFKQTNCNRIMTAEPQTQ